MSFNDMCRLCAVSVTRCIAVFGDEGNKVNLEHKLRICSPVTVRSTDTFPKQVCLDCLIELEKVYDFHQKVKGAQLLLKTAEQSRKRRLSETEEDSSRKRIHFGYTTLSNLSTSFEVLNANKDSAATPLLADKNFAPPLSVYINSDTSSKNVQGTPEKTSPVKNTPKKISTGKGAGPLRNMRKFKTEPESPLKDSVSPGTSQAPSSPALRKRADSSDETIFKSCKFCERKFLLIHLPQHEALHKEGTVYHM